MTTAVTLLSDDAPATAYYGHARGVYDWDVSGRNKGRLPVKVRRLKSMRACITAVPRWSKSGKRQVRMAVGGKVIGHVQRDGTWVLYPDGVNRKENVTGSNPKFQGCLVDMAAAL